MGVGCGWSRPKGRVVPSTSPCPSPTRRTFNDCDFQLGFALGPISHSTTPVGKKKEEGGGPHRPPPTSGACPLILSGAKGRASDGNSTRFLDRIASKPRISLLLSWLLLLAQ